MVSTSANDMTTRTDAGAEKSFFSRRLPWILAALAAVVYLITLNHWLSPRSLQVFARVTGQVWFTDVSTPVFHLVTTPFGWLPETWVPVAMNVFSMVCAAAVLGLLARCVALLPQDRTQMQREREQSPFGLLSLPAAWIPPALAVMVCGLQLTFWENATTLSSDMFDLVLFAYSVRCLLEYRISRRESWLLRAIFVYATGMTDTWILIALLPAFVAAVIWIRGLEFFELRFLSRVFLCGLAGLLFYLYLPLMHLRSDRLVWDTLKTNFKGEFQAVAFIYRHAPHPMQFLIVLTSLLPILVIGIRWKSHFGDSSQLGTMLTKGVFHLTHALLLGVCVWAAFDTGFSLRDAQSKFSFLDFYRDKMLPLYFLSALSIGYFAGYFLLVFRPVTQRFYRSNTTLSKILNHASVSVICAVLLFAPLGLLYKNLPQIRITNGPAWREFASALTENLPPRAVLLSDRSDVLLLAQGCLAQSGKAKDFVFAETRWLKLPDYHRFEKARYPEVWPDLPKAMSRKDFRFGDSALVNLLGLLQEKLPVYYLHPSFGAFFENFYQVPHGLVYEFKQYPTNTVISAPPLPEAIFAENEAFWKQHEPNMRQLLPFINPPGPGAKPTFRRYWMQHMHISFETNATAAAVGSLYSLALNTLGTQDQRLGRLEAAGRHFAEAGEYSPNNLVAAANIEFNTKLRTDKRVVADSPKAFEKRFGEFGNWEQILDQDGLFDTATGCLAQGIVFARGGLIRQGAQSFERVLSLDPDNLLGRFWLAQSYIRSRTPEKALPLIEQLKAHADAWNDASITAADILRLELGADYANRKIEKVSRTIEGLTVRSELDTAIQTCMNFRDYTNALVGVEKRLQATPDDVPALVTDGFANMCLSNFVAAIPPLNRAVSLQPTNSNARLFRAVAYLQSGRLDEAQHDYDTLEKTDPAKKLETNYGFAELARLKKDTNTAIRYYQLCLSEMPQNSPRAQFITDRINSLKTGSP